MKTTPTIRMLMEAYQKFGAEVASSISGDDIRTVMHYYADPSAVNVEGVRVVDLL